jgi:sterol desaturase/sphingolipid hydroxylase (fatty acid hydroxylase superfamily)
MFSKLTFSMPLQVPDLRLPEFTAEEWQSFMILAVFAVLLATEAGFARRERQPKEYRRSYLANFGTFFLNDTLLSLLSVSSLWLVAGRYAEWGLLSGLPDTWLKAALAFVLLDLTLYAWHRACHSFDWLWIFHKVHHSDRVMNVSTAFRLHIVEVLLTIVVKALFIVAVGVDAALVVANEVLITLFVMFHHARLTFPGERWLGRLAIVPYLHRVHHSAQRSEHDSNYGAVFSWWDRLFGTLKELEPAAIGLRNVPALNVLQLVRFGLTNPVFAGPAAIGAAGSEGGSGPLVPTAAGLRPLAGQATRGQTLLQLVRLGLRPPVGPNPQTLRAMIAEAAYYRAEKRGFAPGFEFLDWVEAEREIRGF